MLWIGTLKRFILALSTIRLCPSVKEHTSGYTQILREYWLKRTLALAVSLSWTLFLWRMKVKNPPELSRWPLLMPVSCVTTGEAEPAGLPGAPSLYPQGRILPARLVLGIPAASIPMGELGLFPKCSACSGCLMSTATLPKTLIPSPICPTNAH